MTDEQKHNQELSDIRAIAEKCFAFIRKVCRPRYERGKHYEIVVHSMQVIN